MRLLRHRFLTTFCLLLPCCLGCRFVAEALLRGLGDSTFESQYYDGPATTGREKRARFEEGHIRFMKGQDAYRHDGTVPGIE